MTDSLNMWNKPADPEPVYPMINTGLVIYILNPLL